MKYKTLARLAVKLLGVYLVAEGAVHLVSGGIFLFGQLTRSFSMPWASLSALASPVVYLALGSYLFFDGTWVVDKIIPSNRPYCPECGYELTGLVSGRCPECGTLIPPELVPQAPAGREPDRES